MINLLFLILIIVGGGFFAWWFFNLSLLQMWIVVAATLAGVGIFLFGLGVLSFLFAQVTLIICILNAVPGIIFIYTAHRIYRDPDWFINHFS